ncbi:MAG: PrsW family intramembrane metalloprotease [Candidatus Pacebacteria bacterium]|nr:PrsW family intramembrane metalloprotease [Candidatus Paceibacterota bacterium]
MPPIETFIFAFLGGLLPALLWLWFWLRQDKHPEPKRLIFLAFFMGMLSVPFVVPFERYAQGIFTGTMMIASWAAIEELLKFGFAYFSVLRRKELNEPIDAVIYMISIALGFAALENTLFLVEPIADGDLVTSILTGNFRFLGATLLHVLSSATVGVFMALSFYRGKKVRSLFTIVGLILAILLHTLFNFFIINSNETNILLVFAFVWAGIVALMLMLEKIKRIKQKCWSLIKRK